MSPEEIARILSEEFGGRVRAASFDTAHPYVVVEASAWHDVALFLRDDERMGFAWLRCISGLDLPEENQVAAVYDLHAMNRPEGYSPEAVAKADPLGAALWTERQTIAVRVLASRDDPHIPSVADVWPAAEWHEREAYDLMGITFDGNPNMTRILCPDDWVGHPLRKDYEFPREYEGIADPATAEAATQESAEGD